MPWINYKFRINAFPLNIGKFSSAVHDENFSSALLKLSFKKIREKFSTPEKKKEITNPRSDAQTENLEEVEKL